MQQLVVRGRNCFSGAQLAKIMADVKMHRPLLVCSQRMQAEILDRIMVSAGKIGFQIQCRPEELLALVGATTADVTVE